MPITNKVYIWSILAEPLLFFVLVGQDNWSAITLTLSRVLQLAFLALFFLRIVSTKNRFTIVNPLNVKYQYITIYIILIIASSFIGILLGSYYDANPNPEITKRVYAGIFGGNFIRPFFEIFIQLYYFIYFLILPRYMIRTQAQLQYLIKLGFALIWLVVVLGLLDVAFAYFGGVTNNIPNIDLICRHLVDTRCVEVGLRFHSVLGEPRDANVYMFFAISFIFLSAAIKNNRLPNKSSILILIICATLTQSFSALVGLFIAIGLLIYFGRLSLKKLLYIFFSILFVGFICYIGYYFSLRTQQFFMEIINSEIKSGYKVLSDLVLLQSTDIVPFFLVFERIIHFDLYHLLFGSGIGSASFFTNNFIHEFQGLNNPRAQITRLLFESGFLGLYVYLLILIKPVKEMMSGVNERYHTTLWVSAIFLISATMAHRSHLALIYTGIIMAVIINNLYNQKEKL